MPKFKNCACWRCNHRWQDFPGGWAQLTKHGCPNCGHLYWTETDASLPTPDQGTHDE